MYAVILAFDRIWRRSTADWLRSAIVVIRKPQRHRIVNGGSCDMSRRLATATVTVVSDFTCYLARWQVAPHRDDTYTARRTEASAHFSRLPLRWYKELDNDINLGADTGFELGEGYSPTKRNEKRFKEVGERLKLILHPSIRNTVAPSPHWKTVGDWGLVSFSRFTSRSEGEMCLTRCSVECLSVNDHKAHSGLYCMTAVYQQTPAQFHQLTDTL